MEGFIQLHRKMLEWEWYDDINTKVLFIHLLLKANWKDKKWRGIDIERGTLITSLDNLSKETGLSKQQVRTSINKLKSTHEITHEGHTSYSLIKLIKYNEYQNNNTQDNIQSTHEQHTSNTRATSTNKDNNTNKVNNNTYKSKDGFDRDFIKLELGRFIITWNNTFGEKRQITDKLEKAYLILRKKYNKEELVKGYKLYQEAKLDIKKREGEFKYLLSPLSFFTSSKGLINYL